MLVIHTVAQRHPFQPYGHGGEGLPEGHINIPDLQVACIHMLLDLLRQGSQQLFLMAVDIPGSHTEQYDHQKNKGKENINDHAHPSGNLFPGGETIHVISQSSFQHIQ